MQQAENTCNIVVKVIVFLLIGLIIVQIITPIFIPKWNNKYGDMTQKIKGIYTETENSIDVVILGNSDAQKGISTMTLWEKYGISSYNLGTPLQTSWTSYYLLQEICKYQKPKLVVYETDSLFEEKDRRKVQLRKVYDNMKLSANKVKAVLDSSYNNSVYGILSYAFPLIKFHSRWNELDKDDFKYAYCDYEDQLKGYQICTKGKAHKKGNKYLTENDKDVVLNNMPEQSEEYMQKIVDLCKQNNINLVLVEVPSASSWSYKKSNIVSDFAKKNSVEFLDLNLNYEDFGFDWKKDTQDKGNHLNTSGAEKVASYLGDIMSKKYQINNRKSNPNYFKWNEDLKIYEELKKNYVD